MTIKNIIIHCSATENGVSLAEFGKCTAAEKIDAWHKARGFHRNLGSIRRFNNKLKYIGYHFVIDTDGYTESGREIGEIGAHARGYNRDSVGICLVGGLENGKGGVYSGKYTVQQWQALRNLLERLYDINPNANLLGHRDLSPDLNGYGKITPNEFMKTCPCFDVSVYKKELSDNGTLYQERHLFKE